MSNRKFGGIPEGTLYCVKSEVWRNTRRIVYSPTCPGEMRNYRKKYRRNIVEHILKSEAEVRPTKCIVSDGLTQYFHFFLRPLPPLSDAVMFKTASDLLESNAVLFKTASDSLESNAILDHIRISLNTDASPFDADQNRISKPDFDRIR